MGDCRIPKAERYGSDMLFLRTSNNAVWFFPYGVIASVFSTSSGTCPRFGKGSCAFSFPGKSHSGKVRCPVPPGVCLCVPSVWGVAWMSVPKRQRSSPAVSIGGWVQASAPLEPHYTVSSLFRLIPLPFSALPWAEQKFFQGVWADITGRSKWEAIPCP